MLLKAPIDLTDCRTLKAFFRECRTAIECRPGELVLDLSDVECADSKLIACLVLIERDADRCGIDCAVIASTSVRRWADVLGLKTLLRVG